MNIVNLKIKDLKPYERNAKTHPKENIEAIKKSIQKYGFADPIGVWGKQNIIVEGHGRYLACKELGIDEVPCIRLDHLTDEERREYTLMHNKTTMMSDFDFDLLGEELFELDLGDFELDWGLPELVEEEKPKELVEDEVKTDNIPKRTEKGDIWKLGNHYLGCGDSTDFLWLKTLMQGKKADLVFTDPPYGMKKEKDGVANDNLNYDKLLEFNKQWIPLTFDLLKDNGSWYCWGIDEPLMDIYSNILKPMIKENKITFRNLITWNKGNGQGQLSEEFRMYPIADEKCLFVMCGKNIKTDPRTILEFNACFEPMRRWFENERKKSGLSAEQLKKIDSSRVTHYWSKNQNAFPIEKSYEKIKTYCIQHNIDAFRENYSALKKKYVELKKQYDKKRKEFQEEFNYFDNTHDNMNNVWHFDRTNGEERESVGGHATPKPIALCGRAIKSSSRENEIVLDVFGGSGSTLIACEQLNRICYCNELEPHWCDVIINRWERFTGKKAEKLN